MEAIKIKGNYYSVPKKEPLTVAHSRYLNRMYWSGEAYEFYVYCHIANRFEYFKSPYMTTLDKMSKEINMDKELLVRIINSLIDNNLISVSMVSGKTECYAIEVTEDSEEISS